MTQITVELAASGDDGIVYKQDTAWPPAGTATADTTVDPMTASWDKNGATYTHGLIIARFDTSAIPDTATITSASLRYQLGQRQVDDVGRHFAVDWYDPGSSIDAADYLAPSVTGTAFIESAELQSGGGGDLTGALTSPDANINKTGYTGLRLGIQRQSGAAAPTDRCFLTTWAFGHVGTGENPLALIIDYTIAAVSMATSRRDPGLLRRIRR